MIGFVPTPIPFVLTNRLMTEASTGRRVAQCGSLKRLTSDEWEELYRKTMEAKYSKYSRNFTAVIPPTLLEHAYSEGKEAPLYIIARQRGGPSFKAEYGDTIYYAPISKGYPMQEVSSFSLGPIVGSGLCLVNAAFSKAICTFHLEGGKCDLARKDFWRHATGTSRERNVDIISQTKMRVDGKKVDIQEWLDGHRELWYDEWKKWSTAIALCSRGDLHWTDKGPTVIYRYNGRYIGFVEWKKECYIGPSYNLLPNTNTFKFLMKVWKKKRIGVGLVHPMGENMTVTREKIREMFDSEDEMVCQPYVVAGRMMGVPVYEE